MTEVPEHLLKRAAEARSRLSGEGGDAGGSDAGDAAPAAETAPAAATPAPVESAPVPEVPAEPERVAPEVEAARSRKTIPYWVMPVLLFMPIWAIYYVGYLERPDAAPEGLLFEGGEIYAGQCAGCHGGTGGGGSGRALNGGEVLLTFPVEGTAGYDGLAGHISWVINGTGGTQANEGATYGDPGRPGGVRGTGSFGNMGGFGNLSLEELVAVVHYERVQHGELGEDEAEFEELVLEEFLVLREEAGATDWDAESVAVITEQLDEARAIVGGDGGEAAAE